MSLFTLNELMKLNAGRAVGAFNTINMEMTEAIFEAAEEENVPLIVMIYAPIFKKHGNSLVPMIKGMVRGIKVPVCLHLDHALRFDEVVQAIRMGFSSVMIDASALPIEENIKITKKVVDIAHACNVSVEAELGYVPTSSNNCGNKQFTKPEQAEKFAKETNVDALAIAVGNVHSGKIGGAKINNDLITEIRSKISCMLVLHGGTSLANGDIKNVVNAGINKINFFTELWRAYNTGLAGAINAAPEQLINSSKKGVKAVVKEKMRLVSCIKTTQKYNLEG